MFDLAKIRLAQAHFERELHLKSKREKEAKEEAARRAFELRQSLIVQQVNKKLELITQSRLEQAAVNGNVSFLAFSLYTKNPNGFHQAGSLPHITASSSEHEFIYKYVCDWANPKGLNVFEKEFNGRLVLDNGEFQTQGYEFYVTWLEVRDRYLK